MGLVYCAHAHNSEEQGYLLWQTSLCFYFCFLYGGEYSSNKENWIGKGQLSYFASKIQIVYIKMWSPFAPTRMGLETVILSEVRQSETSVVWYYLHVDS